MAEANEHLLGEMEDQSHYSAMDMEDPKAPQPNEGLLSSSENQSSLKINKRALVIFFGVTVVAVAVIVVAVVVSLYSGGFQLPVNRSKRNEGTFTLDDVFSGKYQPAFTNVDWLSDDSYKLQGAGGSILIVDAASGASREIISASKLDTLDGKDYKLSPDKALLLYAKNKTGQYRYSSFADYYVYNIKAGTPAKQIPTAGDAKIQYARWAPTSNALVFVVKNDMYYIKDASQSVSNARRLTNSGDEHKIFNGVPDWVYQEEVLNADNAIYFSPDSRYLVYLQFNDTSVIDYVFPWYGSSSNSYTSQRRIAYPKSGTPNPTVHVKFLDLVHLPAGSALPTPWDLKPPAAFSTIEHYVVNIGWPANSFFTVQWLNRFQNHSLTQICPFTSKVCSKGHEQKVKGGWVDDKYATPVFAKDKSYYLLLYPFPQSGMGNFIHLASVNTKDSTVSDLTPGAWEVTKLLAFDDVREMAFYESTETSPTQRHIYSYSIRDKKKTCLTCDLPATKSLDCSFYKADFSLKGSWYVLSCQGPGIPQSQIRSTKTGAARILETNEELKQKLKYLKPASTKFITVRSGDYDINVKLVYPPDFHASKKYAVFFSVYGGPGTQNVLETWQLGYEGGFLVHNYDLIMAYVDGRGTMGRGERYKHEVYRDLGRREAEDTINVAKFMATKPYVNRDKIAIWGWSYGGYLTSYILGQNSGVFKLGMAVAPVADWRYYDSIYTERYMGLPQENHKGYKDSSVLPLLKNFKNISYLIVHGTGDDNVHFQNSAQIVKKLTALEVDFRVQFYTDRNHGLSGGGTTDHLYHLLTNFLSEKLPLKKTS